MSKICIIGHFAFGKELLNGQTIKTKNLYRAFCEAYGCDSVAAADTHSLSRNPVKLLSLCLSSLKKHENIILLPAQNGVRVLVPLFVFLNRFYHRRLYYNVIGGWLPSLLQDKPALSRFVKRLDGVVVETQHMKAAMEALGFSNLCIASNFKFIVPLSYEQLIFNRQKPFRLCTFSRVMAEKGIEDAVNAVTAVNRALGETAFSLDIYGPVDDNYKNQFSLLKSHFPPFVRYQGTIPASNSVAVIKEYFALLFPTRFFTEGVPGTLIDAFFAGVPVIAARWQSFDDVMLDGRTGLGYPMGDTQALVSILKECYDNPERLNGMKKSCLEHAKQYMPNEALEPFFQMMQSSDNKN
ncbi:MAG: glycosyltransferase [Eubacteriales bacterium]